MYKNAKKVELRPLAYGEVTGHMHAVTPSDQHKVEMYELDDGSTALLVTGDCIRIVHGKDPGNLARIQPGEDRHGVLTLDPDHPTQQRQGDVLLTPIKEWGRAWIVTVQIEEGPDEVIRQVKD